MTDMAILTTFLGWCSVINLGILAFAALWLALLGDVSKRIHSAMSRVDESELDRLYFHFLGNYKLAIIVLNIAPYFALKIMA